MASATSGSGVETCGKLAATGTPSQTPVLTVACRMLRSPSHESVTTDLSLFSVSSIASEAQGTGGRMRLATFKSYSEAQLSARGPSPNPPNKTPRPPDIPEIIWFEEENDLIKSCAALSSALGFQKSFSTSDISNLPSPEDVSHLMCRGAVSDLALSALQRSGYFLDRSRLDHTSRSCSTWVAVGDVSTSQLPSPHGGHSMPPAPAAISPPIFNAADLIRSVNKKVRQNYIKRRLLTTYKALERLSQSEFNLDRLELQAASEVEKQASATVAMSSSTTAKTTTKTTLLTVPGTGIHSKPFLSPGSLIRAVKPDNWTNKNFPLTLCDVERDRGKPLSKYERNMMIFNWLHTLDDAAFEGIHQN